MEESPAHCTTAEVELRLYLEDLIDFYSDIPSLLSSSELPVSPELTMEVCNELLSAQSCLSVLPRPQRSYPVNYDAMSCSLLSGNQGCVR